MATPLILEMQLADEEQYRSPYPQVSALEKEPGETQAGRQAARMPSEAITKRAVGFKTAVVGPLGSTQV